jgi:predicted aldo/keto reductase-like oxidoreductase
MADTYPESIKKLGFGFMRLPRKGDKVDYEPMRVLVDAFLARGFSYFDTAYVYEGSEESLRETLVRRHPERSFRLQRSFRR